MQDMTIILFSWLREESRRNKAKTTNESKAIEALFCSTLKTVLLADQIICKANRDAVCCV
jgi:hypothetical protein